MNQLTAANHNCTNLGVSYETHEESTIYEIRCKYTCVNHSMSAKNGEHEEHVCAPHSLNLTNLVALTFHTLFNLVTSSIVAAPCRIVVTLMRTEYFI
jgi:hypothetical protein